MNALSRRQFLRSAVASAAVGAAVPRWAYAAGAQPLGPSEGMLVVVTLNGGCDSLSVLVPRSGARRTAYEAARRDIAIGASSLLAATDDHGLHPNLPRLAERYAAGKVAVIDGVAMPNNLRSHFVSTAVSQSASLTPRTTGWLGRHLDGYPDRADELMSVTVSPVVPLHLQGAVSQAAALPPGVGLWGADTTWRHERTAYDAVRAFAAAPLGRGPWADQIAATGGYALDKAAVSGSLATSAGTTAGIRRDMELAAHVLNADIGTRVVGVQTSGYDTHASQNTTMPRLLGDLDGAIDHFFATLAPERHNRVMVLVVSEFGRMAPMNASLGTDHGHAGLALAIGANVAGGLHSELPSIDAVDKHDSLVPSVDLRQVYATVIDRWLGGDSTESVGGQHGHLDFVAAPPGSTA